MLSTESKNNDDFSVSGVFFLAFVCVVSMILSLVDSIQSSIHKEWRNMYLSTAAFLSQVVCMTLHASFPISQGFVADIGVSIDGCHDQNCRY